MGKKLYINCVNCGEEFRTYPNWVKRNNSVCCSRKCAAELKSKLCTKVCEECGVSFQGKSHQGERKFCSRKCSERGRSGEKSHFFIKNKVPHVRLTEDANFKRWSSAVKERDLYICQKCGNNKQRELQAHHINKVSENKELAFDIKNGITLCIECHAKEHADDSRIYNLILSHYKQIENEKFKQKIA